MGIFRSCIGLPFEHPFDKVKTLTQSDLSLKGSVDATKSIYKNSGLRGFYDGYTMNLGRLAFFKRFSLFIVFSHCELYSKKFCRGYF
jgi:hypothetical protein